MSKDTTLPTEGQLDTPTQATVMGRPSDYTEDLADYICAEVSEGKSLKRICERDDMPSRQTVFSWFRKYNDFLDNYTRAKEASADAYAEDIENIADDVLKGKIDPQAARVAGDLKKWTASKLKPKKYGDKIDMTSDGEKLGVTLSADQTEQLLRARATRNSGDI